MTRPVPVIPEPKGPRSWSYPQTGEFAPSPALMLQPADLFTRAFDTDAHFQACSSSVPHRLNGEAPKVTDVAMVMLVVDIDPPAHAPRTTQWDDDLRAKVRHVPGKPWGYWTRGGARLVWMLESGRSTTDWNSWYLSQLVALTAVSGIVFDPKCADWPHLYRCPHATRDGVLQAHGWLTGHPGSIGAWSEIDLDDVTRASALAWLGAQSTAWTSAARSLVEHEPQPQRQVPAERGDPLAWAVQRVENAGKGDRNDTLYQIARWLRGKAADDDIAAELKSAAMRAGLSSTEAKRTLSSALTERT